MKEYGMTLRVYFAAHANPKLKVVLIRDGSLLDENSLRTVGEMAEAAGAQVWLETVGKDGEGIIIEDGTRLEPAEKQPAA